MPATDRPLHDDRSMARWAGSNWITNPTWAKACHRVWWTLSEDGSEYALIAITFRENYSFPVDYPSEVLAELASDERFKRQIPQPVQSWGEMPEWLHEKLNKHTKKLRGAKQRVVTTRWITRVDA